MSIYLETIEQFKKILNALSGILDKAVAHAEHRKFDPNHFLGARLAPDMFGFTRQIQIVCDTAKNSAARLAGVEAPKHEDNEKTIAELKDRIKKCTDYLSSFKAEQFEGAAERQITLGFLPNQYILGKDYLIEFALPNFYFHATTAYNLLRNAGVEIGKMDFLASLKMHNK
jgi:hypothetical protein